ncbi:MAG: glycosyltransferase [Gammaproteobacteria bacterium]|nr:glycosyltransferase [Gammaproteobacteria bacterium]
MAPDGAAPAGATASLQARLRERYFRMIYFVDPFKKWSWHAARAAVRAGKEHRPALVLASAPPHSTLLAGSWAARRLGVPFIADMRDPWSDVLAITEPRRRTELWLLRSLEGWVVRHAAAVTSTSASAAALLVERFPTRARAIHVIRNGFDGEVAPPLTRTGHRLSILFAGMLYVGRTPYPLLAALERLLARPDVDPGRVQLTFMGGKAGSFSEQALGRWLQGTRCASVVRIIPAQGAEAVEREVARSTVLLNLAQQQRLQVPAKTFEQLASGREILLICEADCETARVVAGIEGVTRVDESEPQVLDAVLLDLYQRHAVGGNARVPTAVDVRRFSRSFANERFAAVLDAVAPPAGGGAGSLSVPLPISPPPAPLRPAEQSLAIQLAADIRFYRSLTRPAGAAGFSLAATLLSNRCLWLLAFHRVGNYCLRRRNVRSPAWWLARLCKSFGNTFNVVVCRSQLSEDCSVGAGAYLANHGYILCGALGIGAGSLIHDRCTFGYAVADGGEGRPAIGRDVWIGPNCIIAGPVTVGDGATILPGSFVTFDVPARAVIKGNPALVVCRDFDNSTLRNSLTIVADLDNGPS